MEETKTVLLVDDDADMREQMGLVLQSRYRVATAASGKECLQRVARQRPDCIVLDVMMDGITDGLDTVKRIKASPDTRDIPVIMLTSVNESYDYRTQVEDAHFPHEVWLDKPVAPDRLLREVAALIG